MKKLKFSEAGRKRFFERRKSSQFKMLQAIHGDRFEEELRDQLKELNDVYEKRVGRVHVDDAWDDVLEKFDMNDGPEEEIKTFAHNCGVCEKELDALEYKNKTGIIQSLYSSLHNAQNGGVNSGEHAAVVLTDNRKDAPRHRVLTEIVAPISLGENPNSGENLWMWVVTRDNLQEYLLK